MQLSLLELIVIVAVGIILIKVIRRLNQRAAQKKQIQVPLSSAEPSPDPKPYQPPPMSMVAKQIEAISRANVSTKALLNKGEIDMYWALVRHVDSKSFIVCPQTVMGEFLKTDRAAYSAINSKRVDFCIVDRQWNPVCVVEVDGSGHFVSRNAGQRNAVKKIALDQAGIECRVYNQEKGTVREFLASELARYASAM